MPNTNQDLTPVAPTIVPIIFFHTPIMPRTAPRYSVLGHYCCSSSRKPNRGERKQIPRYFPVDYYFLRTKPWNQTKIPELRTIFFVVSLKMQNNVFLSPLKIRLPLRNSHAETYNQDEIYGWLNTKKCTFLRYKNIFIFSASNFRLNCEKTVVSIDLH